MEAKLILRQGTSPFTENYRYKIQDGKYGRMEEVKDEAGDKILKFVPYGMAIRMKEVVINMETAEKHLVLQVPDSHGNITEVKMPREYLTEQKITDLVKYGAQVNKKSASILLQCLENLEQKAPLLYQHTKTGFSMVGSVQVFKGFHLYCNDKQFNSTYAGSLKIAPQGSFEAWTRMVNQEVLGSKLEVILASALSAVTFDFVHDIFPTENLIISLWRGNIVIVSPDYHLAPEYKFPKGLNEAYDTMLWTVDNISDYGGDENNINVCGDSSGGNFAAVVSIMARDNHIPSINKQILFYPLTTNSEKEMTESEKRYETGYFLEYNCQKDPMQCYFNAEEEKENPLASPLLAKDLSRLPNTCVISAECDPLLDQGLMYAARLEDAGVEVEYHILKGMVHGFLNWTYGESFEAMNYAVEFVRK